MKIRPGSNTAVLIEGVEVIKPIPSLLQVLLRNTRWRDIFDGADGDMKGLMTENVIDDFHTQAVAAIDRLNHAGYTPDQISMETGLMPVKIDVVFEALGIEKQVASPGDVMLGFGENKLPSCHLWEVKHSYYGEAEYNEMNFDTFEEFIENMGNADKDYNYLIRWDWYERNRELDIVTYKGDNNERTGYVKFIYHAQRKGFTMSAVVKVCRNDEPKVRKYLEENWTHLENMWAPVSNGTAERVPESELSARTSEQLVENQYTEIMYADDQSEAQMTVKEALGDFDPKNVKWVKYLFETDFKDIAPALFPPMGPFWYERSSNNDDKYEVTAYLPEGVPFESYWPTVEVAASYEVGDRISYPENLKYREWNTEERTRKPRWWPF